MGVELGSPGALGGRGEILSMVGLVDLEGTVVMEELVLIHRLEREGEEAGVISARAVKAVMGEAGEHREEGEEGLISVVTPRECLGRGHVEKFEFGQPRS